MSEYKTLRGTTFHILGGNKVLSAMMSHEGSRATGVNRADFIIFMGGVDINPKLYGEQPHERTQPPNNDRDRMETALYRTTPDQFHIGICRGAQLLHVLNGGGLWQHVEGHLGNHHIDYVNETGFHRAYTVSSTHHQMMKISGPHKPDIWAVANLTTKRELSTGASFRMTENHWSDPEILRYKDTNTLCFQPHPEHISPKETRELFYKCLVRMVET